MATHSVLLPGKTHWWRSLVGCSPWGREELDTTEWLHCHFSLSCTGEGNGNPLQCSCLENTRDGGAWWASIYEVAQSRTWLKQLSSSSSSMVKVEFDSWALLLEKKSVMLMLFPIFILKHEVVQWCLELKQNPITLLAFWYWASDSTSLGMGVQNIKIFKGKRWKPSKLSDSNTSEEFISCMSFWNLNIFKFVICDILIRNTT